MRSGAWLGFKIQLDDDFVTDEVISFTCIDDAKVFPIDVELGSDLHRISRLRNRSGEADILVHTVERKVAGYGIRGVSRLGDGSDVKGGLGIFLHVEKVRALEVPREFLAVREGGVHIDIHLVIGAYRCAILERKVAGEGFEAAIMAARYLGADEVYLRVFGKHILGADSFWAIGFFNSCFYFSLCRLIRWIFAGDEGEWGGNGHGGEGDVFGLHNDWLESVLKNGTGEFGPISA